MSQIQKFEQVLQTAKSVKELESGPNRIDINQIVDVVQDSVITFFFFLKILDNHNYLYFHSIIE